VQARLWIDVDDLFEYVRADYRRPTGIQRLAFEVYRELQARYGNTGQVCFVRHSLAGNGFQVVAWSEVAALFTGLVDNARAPAPHRVVEPAFPRLPARKFVRVLAYRLPPSLRLRVIDAVRTQGKAMYAWGRLISSLGSEAAKIPSKLLKRFKLARRSNRSIGGGVSSSPLYGQEFADLAAPGDILLMLGATWSHPDYAGLIRRQCKANGLQFAMLLYDLIPLRRPEWCPILFVREFRKWIDQVLPLCDIAFAISNATASDVQLYAKEQGIRLPGPVTVLPIGSELRHVPGPRSKRLPQPGSYVLIVATIEARKNHLLLFRIWRRMLEEMPHERVPTLVFAGRVGWMVDDLMQQIANTDNLGGKLLIIEGPCDVELAALYGGCLFTLFPSFYEGWGLPVTESLAFGKPCLIANRTSLPEAGGNLVRSFDPDNLHDAYAVVRQTIEDPAGLAQWEAQVRREFKPVSWSETVDALLMGLGDPLSPSARYDATATDARSRLYADTLALEGASGNKV
jgi:glycosyltransferase involved in cell wall biosynthesis